MFTIVNFLMNIIFQIQQLLGTKFSLTFLTDWFLQPSIGCNLFLIDIPVRVMIHS